MDIKETCREYYFCEWPNEDKYHPVIIRSSPDHSMFRIKLNKDHWLSAHDLAHLLRRAANEVERLSSNSTVATPDQKL